MTTEKTRTKIVDTFMSLVADTPWDDVTMPAVAKAAGVKLETLRATYDSRLDILEDLARRADVAVLKDLDPNLEDETIRDRFFEVLMQRLDVLAPYKAGLKVLSKQARRDPVLGLTLYRIVFRSQGWMVMASGLGAGGLQGAVRTQAVTMAYLEAMDVWLDDDEPGLARTMAALDKALSKAQGRLKMLARIGKMVMPSAFRDKNTDAQDSKTADAGSA